MSKSTENVRIITMFEKIEPFFNYYDSSRPVNILMAGISYCDKSYHIERRNCNCMSFEYIIDGSGTLEINGRTYYPKKGDIYILTKHSDHRYYSDGDDPWKKIWVLFDGPLVLDMASKYLEPELYLVENCNIHGLMEDLLNITKIYAGDYDRLTDEATVILLRIMIQIKNRLNSKSDRLPERIKQELDRGLENNITLDDLCVKLNYTKNHIIKVFRDNYGMTPYAYYREKKIEIAKGYLENTGMSVTEISERLGFADSQYFAGCFKEAAGITPTAYRKSSSHKKSEGAV